LGIPSHKGVSIEEYLELEANSDTKHEYYDGEIFAMAGETIEHNKICGNTYGELYLKLKGKNCRPYVNDLRIAVKRDKLYTYPDISVFCGELQKTDDKFDTATNPTAIIEVLSDSTKDYDRGSKFKFYRNIDQLQDYLLIDATGIVGVEHFSKNQNGLWVLKEYKELEEMLYIQSIDTSLVLSDIYAGVY
jgi:Uma2 family endonuclease